MEERLQIPSLSKFYVFPCQPALHPKEKYVNARSRKTQSASEIVSQRHKKGHEHIPPELRIQRHVG